MSKGNVVVTSFSLLRSFFTQREVVARIAHEVDLLQVALVTFLTIHDGHVNAERYTLIFNGKAPTLKAMSDHLASLSNTTPVR